MNNINNDQTGSIYGFGDNPNFKVNLLPIDDLSDKTAKNGSPDSGGFQPGDYVRGFSVLDNTEYMGIVVKIGMSKDNKNIETITINVDGNLIDVNPSTIKIVKDTGKQVTGPNKPKSIMDFDSFNVYEEDKKRRNT
jgi:hypothetical protein